MPHGFVNNPGESSLVASPSSWRACGLKVLTENDPTPLCCRCPGTWNSTHHHHQTAEALHLCDLQQWQVRGVTHLALPVKERADWGGWGEWGAGAWLKATSTELLRRAPPFGVALGDVGLGNTIQFVLSSPRRSALPRGCPAMKTNFT